MPLAVGAFILGGETLMIDLTAVPYSSDAVLEQARKLVNFGNPNCLLCSESRWELGNVNPEDVEIACGNCGFIHRFVVSNLMKLDLSHVTAE